MADALYIVKVEPATDAVTWTPTLPSAGTYQVYAIWTAEECRATDAGYSIVHSGGTTAVTRNQRVGGGLWQFLGSYSFDPLLNPTVTLAANDNGSVAADALRFVGGPAGATDIAYLHSDHLGTPQVMTDASAQILWWRDQTPFGQTVATGGFSETPLRSPGQFADPESGLAYNYFRDDDPALGRHIRSDPIGLAGGLNTYEYVRGNPLKWADPYGLLVFPWTEEHRNRNQYNKSPIKPPKRSSCLDDDGYYDESGEEWLSDNPGSAAIFHGGRNGFRKPNDSGPGGSQCFYDRKAGDPIMEGGIQGTYDYSSPETEEAWDHF